MESTNKCRCVVLVLSLLFSLVNAQPSQPKDTNETISPDLPPLIFPKENVTVGNGPAPLIFPTENVTTGIVPIPVVKKEDFVATVKSGEESDMVPLIFPKTNDKVPIIDLPPLIFPDDNTTSTNHTAMEILNASGMHNNNNIVPLPPASDENYYDSSEDSDVNTSVEEVQADDKGPQQDDLEENYKLGRPRTPVDDYDDNTEVDHPTMMKNSHILGIIGAVLAVLCVCLFLGITVWRRVMFNRYGMRERLINEDDFYSSRSMRHNF